VTGNLPKMDKDSQNLLVVVKKLSKIIKYYQNWSYNGRKLIKTGEKIENWSKMTKNGQNRLLVVKN
jgi:cephalosporin hydroxylase